jgi:aspartyl protease family protein
MFRLWIASAMLLIAQAALAGSVYKCKGPDDVLLYQESPCTANDQAISSWSQSSKAEGNGTLVLSQEASGHYFVDGSINDHPMHFVIDTGATYVTIPVAMAKSAGLHCQQMGTVQTANGTAPVCASTVDKLHFGNFTLHDVMVAITPNLDQPLLGMNVLKRFHIDQDGNQMRLSRNY